MGRSYGVATPPRAVIHAFDELDVIRPVVARYAQTIRDSGYDPIRWSDWDVLITTGGVQLSHDAKSLRVVQFGGDPIGRYAVGRNAWGDDGSVSTYTAVGSSVHEADGLDDGFEELVGRHLVECLDLSKLERLVLQTPSQADNDAWMPLLLNPDQEPIAAVFRPDYGPREVWYFPGEALPAIDAILHFAFTRWHLEAPGSFPAAPNWTSDQRWMTANQQNRFLELRSKIADSNARIAAAKKENAESEEAIEQVRRDASTSEQRLLTADGDELVAAVTAALTGLRFEVVDLDAETPEGKPKIGDLEVSHPDFPDWKIMAEVKGKTKGAALNDLLALQTHRRVYEKTRPTLHGVWYLVNAERRNPDPGSRPVPLESATDEIDTFAEDHGLVIDARDLFQLVKSVQLQLISKRAAAGALIEQYGRFKLPVGQTPTV